MKILAIKLRAIGDSVIWTSALAALRRAYPDAEIHILTYASNSAVFANSTIDRAHFLHGKSRWELIRMLWSLRGEKFDWLLGFHATTSLCRWAWLVGAQKMALHHHSWPRTPKGSVPIAEPGKLENAIARDYQLLGAMAGRAPRREPTRILVTQPESEQAEARVRDKIVKTNRDVGRPRFLFLPGAGHHLRRYPKDLWWPLVLRARDEGKFQPVVVVDSELCREWGLEDMCAKENIPLIAGGGLREFMTVISRGQRALANDSGPGHIAVALGLNTDFIFGPGCVGDWHCYDRVQHPLHRVAVDCRGEGPRELDAFQFCTVDVCDHHRCMRGVRPLAL